MTHFTKYKLFPFISFLLLVPPLSFLPCFPSQFCFNNYSMHHIFALVICPFCSIFILFCSICYHLYPFTLSLFHLFLSHCSMPRHSCRLCIVCTSSIHPSSTLYLVMPVLFYPLPNILPLMPLLPQFLFPYPLFLLFPSFASFSVHRPQPNENKNGQDSKVSVEVPFPFYPFHSSEKINTWVGHCQRLLGT